MMDEEIKPFEVPTEIVNDVETQIKRGECIIEVITTQYERSFAEDIAEYYRKQGFVTARIVDLYYRGRRVGNYLRIDIE